MDFVGWRGFSLFFLTSDRDGICLFLSVDDGGGQLPQVVEVVMVEKLCKVERRIFFSDVALSDSVASTIIL